MGQGYSLTTLSAGSAGIDVPELADLTFEKALGDARFMKAVRARHRDGLIVAKVVMKPYASMKFERYINDILRERKILADIPNTLAYHRAFETATGGYLVRQYIYSSVYDRMSTRPFLEDIEKRWLAFQLLSAVRDCHAANIYHGDIKTENVLVTSWNWLYLCDFSAAFKPAYLPEDNPADFSFFFDISGRRTCYLAPERFLSSDQKLEDRGGLTWAMDIFSVGCVIAELFLEAPIFSLSQLFRYRQKEYDPTHAILSRIEDPDIQELILHMVQLEPESRYSAEEYLNFWRLKAFPDYFYNFLHQYMHLITDPSSGRSTLTAGVVNLGESDDRIDRVYNDFDKISYFLDYATSSSEKTANSPVNRLDRLIPMHLDIPYRRQITMDLPPVTTDDGTLLFLGVVTSSLRSTARSAAKIKACELFLAFAEKLSDETKLDRVLPFVMSLLIDSSELVRVAALRTLTQVLALVQNTSPVNAYIFPEYILPRLEPFTQNVTSSKAPKATALLRSTYAICVSSLAETAARFLDMMQALKVEGALPSADPESENDGVSYAHQEMFDAARADLVKFFEAQTKSLLTDTDSVVRRAFLSSVGSLCVFFGSAKANDVILSHLNTYLNDRDWKLRSAFFEAIVGVAIYVGGPSLEEFILPLMVPALADPEEAVVEKVLRSLGSMASLGLFQRTVTWRLIELICRFTLHPNIWIRGAAADFVAKSTRFLSPADCECIVRPLIQPYLRFYPSSLDVVSVLGALKTALSRKLLDVVIAWATKTDKGVFWKAMQQRVSLNLMDEQVPLAPVTDYGPNSLTKLGKNEEDQQWLNRLKAAGMANEDWFKILSLQVYIWRMAHQQSRDNTEILHPDLNSIISLKNQGVSLQTVFYDHNQESLDKAMSNDGADAKEKPPQTIADALMDASTTIVDGQQRAGTPLTEHETGDDHDHRNSRLHPNIPEVLSSLYEEPNPSITRPNGQGDRTKNLERAVQQKDSSSTLSTTRRPQSPLRRKESAISLLSKGGSKAKANAETSTSSENAFGSLNITSGPQNPQRSAYNAAKREKASDPATLRFRGAHSYAGRDPHILRLLDSLYLEGYPIDTVEFGPSVTPVAKRQWENKKSNASWRPTGTLIAALGEHTAAIRRVLVSPDHYFFITASDDGTVKVWDTYRLERNVSHRSRQTYKHAADAKVTAICFITNTHAFVSAASDGSLHIVHVDCLELSNTSTKYGKLKPVRQWQLPEPSSHAVWLEHVASESTSTLLVATNTSLIIAIELKTMTTLYTLRNPLSHGVPTTFVLDAHQHWLLLGTSSGLLDLWDLRFGLRLRSWAFAGAEGAKRTPIHRLALHPTRTRNTVLHNQRHGQAQVTFLKRVYVAGGTGDTSVTLWDLEKASCLAVYRSALPAASPLEGMSMPTMARRSTAGSGDAGGAASKGTGTATAAIGTATGEKITAGLTDYTLTDISPNLTDASNSAAEARFTSLTRSLELPTPDLSIRAFVAETLALPSSSEGHHFDDGNGSGSISVEDGDLRGQARRKKEKSEKTYIVAAGPDRRVRFWMLEAGNAQASLVSGVTGGDGEEDTGNARVIEFEKVDNVRAVGDVWEERILGSPRSVGAMASAVTDGAAVAGAKKGSTASLGNSGSGSGSADGKGKGGGSGSGSGSGLASPAVGAKGEGKIPAKQARSTSLISRQQQLLLKSHLDLVTDVAVLEYPFRMVVSVDRSGVALVFA